MPFELKNTHCTFHRVVDIILSSVECQFALVYLVNIVNFLRTASEHINHIQAILSLIEGAGVTLKLEKCALFTNKIDYFGHFMQSGRLEVTNLTTDGIRDLKTPTTKT